MCLEPYISQVPPHMAYVLRGRPPVNQYMPSGGTCAEENRVGSGGGPAGGGSDVASGPMVITLLFALQILSRGVAQCASGCIVLSGE